MHSGCRQLFLSCVYPTRFYTITLIRNYSKKKVSGADILKQFVKYAAEKPQELEKKGFIRDPHIPGFFKTFVSDGSEQPATRPPRYLTEVEEQSFDDLLQQAITAFRRDTRSKATLEKELKAEESRYRQSFVEPEEEIEEDDESLQISPEDFGKNYSFDDENFTQVQVNDEAIMAYRYFSLELPDMINFSKWNRQQEMLSYIKSVLPEDIINPTEQFLPPRSPRNVYKAGDVVYCFKYDEKEKRIVKKKVVIQKTVNRTRIPILDEFYKAHKKELQPDALLRLQFPELFKKQGKGPRRKLTDEEIKMIVEELKRRKQAGETHTLTLEQIIKDKRITGVMSKEEVEELNKSKEQLEEERREHHKIMKDIFRPDRSEEEQTKLFNEYFDKHYIRLLRMEYPDKWQSILQILDEPVDFGSKIFKYNLENLQKQARELKSSALEQIEEFAKQANVPTSEIIERAKNISLQDIQTIEQRLKSKHNLDPQVMKLFEELKSRV